MTLRGVGEGRGGGGQYKKFGRLMAVSGQFHSSFGGSFDHKKNEQQSIKPLLISKQIQK